MFYGVTGVWCIQLLGKTEVAHTGCGSHAIELRHHVSELGDDVQCLEQNYQLLVSEKAAVEEVRSALEAKVNSFTQVNERLMIKFESLERDVADRD